MRGSFALAAFIFAAVFVIDARAFPDGAPWGAANPAIEQNCANCHFGAEPVLDSPALLIQGLPEKFNPGETYDLAIIFADPNIVIAGFQLIARAVNDDSGKFTVAGDDIEFIGASIRSIAPQRSPGRAAWSIHWRAPEDIVGAIDFYVAASAANDDGSPFGDTIHFRSYRLLPN